jgi:uncharacterized membrane-anchored protein
MSTTFNTYFPLKVWSTGLCLAPVVLFLAITLKSSETGFDWLGALILSFGLVVIGGGWSIPVFLIFYYAYKTLIQKSISTTLIKFILIGIAIAGIALMSFLVSGSEAFTGEKALVPISYAITFSISIAVWRIKRKEALPITTVADAQLS